jgi:hypothetical protein
MLMKHHWDKCLGKQISKGQLRCYILDLNFPLNDCAPCMMKTDSHMLGKSGIDRVL